jgi:predicted CXXCH cytochrome family protein
VDCHTDTTEIPHPARPFRTRREFSVAYNEQCKRCHFANFAKTMDGVHARALERGDQTAPLCVDCHGSHDVARSTEPRGRISLTCARCHAGVAATYAKSVHGRALDHDNPDVPACTDCHRAHDVAGPTAQEWLNRTPEMCARCHADEQVMKKYGISTAVQSTYLSDFHGMTASLRGSSGTTGQPVVARCTDCHGVHDILKADEPGSRVLKANLVKTCQQCHPDATENFPAAWLSHYEPSWERAPVVHAVTLAYKFMIPFMIGGLVLQVLLHLWRVVVNR